VKGLVGGETTKETVLSDSEKKAGVLAHTFFGQNLPEGKIYKNRANGNNHSSRNHTHARMH
jgi:hypothetical protein